MSDALSNEVVMTWSMEPDTKSVKETKQSFENMISLISDLAIIGKVAGEALGAVWEGLQDSIKMSLDEFKDINLGATMGVDTEQLRHLEYIFRQIGATEADAMDALTSMDKFIQGVRNAATDSGKAIEDLESTLAVYGVSKEQIDAIKEAIEGEDAYSAIRELGEVRNELGEEFSNFAKAFDISGLSFLEIDYQYEDWIDAWGKASSRVFEVNEEGLNDLENGYADIVSSIEALATNLGADLGPLMADLGTAIFDLTERFLNWKDTFVMPEGIKRFGAAMKDMISAEVKWMAGDLSWIDMKKAQVEGIKQILGFGGNDEPPRQDTGPSAEAQMGAGGGRGYENYQNYIESLNIYTPDPAQAGTAIQDELDSVGGFTQ